MSLSLSNQPDPSKVCAFKTRKGNKLLYASLFATHDSVKDHHVHCQISTGLPQTLCLRQAYDQYRLRQTNPSLHRWQAWKMKKTMQGACYKAHALVEAKLMHSASNSPPCPCHDVDVLLNHQLESIISH